MPLTITLFLITKNEASNITECILSARELAQQVIVVDCGSSDNTVALARKLGAHVYYRKFDGFANQKNFALSKVKTPWALSLDADERITPALCEEIQHIPVHTDKHGFFIKRSLTIFGKRMHFNPDKDKHLRLVRTKYAKYVGGLVHESLTVKGPLGKLQNPLEHFSYDTIDTYFKKFNQYTTLEARKMYRAGIRFSCTKWIGACFWGIIVQLKQFNILDGMRGFLWASFSTFYVFVKYAKLWQLEQQDK